MKRIFSIGIVSLMVVTAAAAATDSIDQRIKIMKSNGAGTKDVALMLKGQAPFDLAKIQATLKSYQDNSDKFVTLFPDDSKSGGDTSASPKIWSDAAGFKAANIKFANDAKLAAETIKDEASFKAAFPAVIKNCGDCHEAYRVKN